MKSIIQQLQQHIVKKTRNLLINWFIIFILITGFFSIMFFVAEYFFYLSPGWKWALFLTYIAVNLLAFYLYLLKPLYHIFRQSKMIRYQNAARELGYSRHDIQDKLLNYLDFSNRANIKNEQILTHASKNYQQQFKNKPIETDFFRVSKRLITLIILMIFGFLVLFITSDKIQRGSTFSRMVHLNKAYQKPEPYYILINQANITLVEGDDLALGFTVEGEYLPDLVFYEFNGHQGTCNYLHKNNYEVKLSSVYRSGLLRLYTRETKGVDIKIIVYKIPRVKNFSFHVVPPPYTGMDSLSFSNLLYFSVPEGSLWQGQFFTDNVKSAYVIYSNQSAPLRAFSENVYQVSQNIFTSKKYEFIFSNDSAWVSDTLRPSIKTIPDKYPKILIDNYQDSVFLTRQFFNGRIKDDYGFHLLSFRILDEQDSTIFTDSIPIQPVITNQYFNYSIDLKPFITNDSFLTYYFTVWDNDEINGYKATKSNPLTFRKDIIDSLKQQINNALSQAINDFSEHEQTLEKLNKSVENLKEQLTNQQRLDWSTKNNIQNLLEAIQKERITLKKKLSELQQNRLSGEQYQMSDPDISRKQKQLEKLMAEVLDEDFKKLMDEISKLMEELDKSGLSEKLKQLEQKSKFFKNQLDRNIELFKHLKLEKDIKQLAAELDSLYQKQNVVQQQTKDANSRDIEKFSSQQESLKKKLSKAVDSLNNIQQQGEELQQSLSTDPIRQMLDSLKNKMSEATQSLRKHRKKQSVEQMEQIKQGLKTASNGLNDMLNAMQQQSLGEDVDRIKQLLENIIDLSQEQEALMDDFNDMNSNNPNYLFKVRSQFAVKEKISIIKDSLMAVARRQPAVKKFVFDELQQTDTHLGQSITLLNDGRLHQGKTHQQYVMTHLNNLSLLLAESLRQMEKQMMSSGQGKGNKGGSSQKPSVSQLRKMQQRLKNSLEQMQQGGMKQGGKGQSEKFARMAAQQAAIRQELQKLQESMKAQGATAKQLFQIAKEMDKSETDLVNKRISEALINRQKQIVTRLLKSEKALREQEKQKERKSETANFKIQGNQTDYLQYKKQIRNGKEFILRVFPETNQYYEKRIDNYLNNRDNQKND
jgi:hypothetical protein